MALELVTGYKGVDHVTADQVADFQRGIYGDGAILSVGSQMRITIETANSISVADGIAVIFGREVSIGYGETVSIPITSGTQGEVRNDLIVFGYSKDSSTGVEKVDLQVITGTPDAKAASDPAVTQADIRTGVVTSQIPLARLRIVGTAINGIDYLIPTVDPLSKAVSDLARIFAGDTGVIVAKN